MPQVICYTLMITKRPKSNEEELYYVVALVQLNPQCLMQGSSCCVFQTVNECVVKNNEKFLKIIKKVLFHHGHESL